jgi:hypothetical protein
MPMAVALLHGIPVDLMVAKLGKGMRAMHVVSVCQYMC